ncbi:MAG TPA: SDR family NAD(P)-dependent oxidoreductase [Coriobacteriia bacterium]|nr:SDR family NAD(P)-dependent oxidoreductase [Coriobacteriia bacterium]
MRVTGTVIVVTGGGSGIGRELVLETVARGARVAAVDIRKPALAEMVTLAGEAAERISTHVADVTDVPAVEALPSAVLEAHGQVDAIINCAGIIQPFVRFADLEYETMRRVMDVNFWGPAYVTKAFLPHLLERSAAHIVNVSSMGAFVPVPGQTLYGASKAALSLLTEGLAAELFDTNVSVTLVYPGATETGIAENSGVRPPIDAVSQDGRRSVPTTPARVAARTIIDAMERDAYRVMVGKDARVMDVFSRLSPERAARAIQKRMKDLLPG